MVIVINVRCLTLHFESPKVTTAILAYLHISFRSLPEHPLVTVAI